jgi:hypothetical protein
MPQLAEDDRGLLPRLEGEAWSSAGIMSVTEMTEDQRLVEAVTYLAEQGQCLFVAGNRLCLLP